MANPLCKIKVNIKRKRYPLYQLGTGVVFFAVLYIYTKISDRPLCLSENLFGISCFGCGLTRGFIAMLSLDFVAATEYNLLSVPLFFGIAVYAVLLIVDILFGSDYNKKMETLLAKKWMFVVYGLLLTTSILWKIEF